MRVDIRVPEVTGLEYNGIQVYIARERGPNAGRISTETIKPNKATGRVQASWRINNQTGRRVGITELRIDPVYAEQGALLVEEEYRKEGRLDLWEQFKAFQDACRAGRVRKPKTDEEREKLRHDPLPGFPTSMLPQSVQELAKEGFGPSHFWTPEEATSGDGTGLGEVVPGNDRGGDQGNRKAAKTRQL